MKTNSIKAHEEISLVLSGGGARGAFHLGLLQALEEKKVNIKVISGTSIGAIVGASYLSGNSPREILEIFCSREFKKSIKFRPFGGAFFDIDVNAPIIKKLYNGKTTFEELSAPLHVNITDIENGKAVYINSGELIPVVKSAGAPLPMLPAVDIKGTLYADGGLMDNFPVKPIKNLPYKIVGSNLHPNPKLKKRGLLSNTLRSLYLCWYSGIVANIDECDVYISPDELTNYPLAKTSKLRELYNFGYRCALKSF